MRRMLLCIGIIALLGGCATEKAVLNFDNAPVQRLFFPAAPEAPRYLYLGELTGERNLRPPGAEAGEAAQSVFGWLVGLGEDLVPKRVLLRPQSGVTDERGRIYVTDVSRQAVFVFDDDAGQLDLWELAEQSVRFVAPIGIALGPDGQVLVADAELGLVARLARDGTPLEAFGKGVLKRPTGVARDPANGLVYVADSRDHDVKVFDDRGKMITVLGGRGSEEGTFNYPTHLAFAQEKLYVTDTLNARVQVFGRDEVLKQTFGERGLYVGNLVRPKGVAVDDEGNIYVIESLYDTLLVFNPQGVLLLNIGGTGKDPGKFFLPAGVWTDRKNRIYVADMFNGRVVVLQYLGE